MPVRNKRFIASAVVALIGAAAPSIAAPPDRRPSRSRPEESPPKPPPTAEDLEIARRRGAAVALATQAQEAYRERRFGEAAELFDKAHLQFAEENFLWNAGQAYERSGELKLAKERYSAFLGNDRVDATTRLEAGEALVRVGRKLAARDAASTPQARRDLFAKELAEAKDVNNLELVRRLEAEIATEDRRIQAIEDAKPSDTAEWIVIGAGGALGVTGLIVGLLGQGKLDDVADAQAGEPELVTRMTRATAEAELDTGETMRTAGLIVGGVGIAAATIGAILLVTKGRPSDTSGVIITSSIMPDGASVHATLRF